MIYYKFIQGRLMYYDSDLGRWMTPSECYES